MENYSKVNASFDAQSAINAREAELKAAAANYNGELVFGQVPQGYDTNINVRIVPIRDLDLIPVQLGCRPRGGGSQPDPGPFTIPDRLVEKLKAADKLVVKWLAQDEANARLFLEQPIEALNKAGVELTRAEQKLLFKTHDETEKSRLVSPGVNVKSISVTALPNGRVGEIKPGPGGVKDGVSIKDGGVKGGGSGDCGCGGKPKGKE